MLKWTPTTYDGYGCPNTDGTYVTLTTRSTRPVALSVALLSTW